VTGRRCECGKNIQWVHIREELNNIGVGFVWQNRQAGVVETTWHIVKTRRNDIQRQMNLAKVRGNMSPVLCWGMESVVE